MNSEHKDDSYWVTMSNLAWQEILNGDPLRGVAILEEVLATQSNIGRWMNCGIGHLLLRDFKSAERAFSEVKKHYITFRPMNVFLGLSLWLQGQELQAVESWLEEIRLNQDGMITNADEGGGAAAPLLLFWHAKRSNNAPLLAQAEIEMNRLILLTTNPSWLHLLMMYILGKTAKEDVSAKIKQSGYTIGRLRNTSVFEFYMASSHLPEHPELYIRGLTNVNDGMVRNAILDAEYHLIKHELYE